MLAGSSKLRASEGASSVAKVSSVRVSIKSERGPCSRRVLENSLKHELHVARNDNTKRSQTQRRT